ncbi:4-hydroxy-tetrahydrodipicolinate reductase [Pontiella desulfatans]|uniref:4-hydroxy-tetrahydrodipicolinate reductase n=1 Tax=Pontiella desulfatans TaxID=2750659 RepID=A0A6C2U7H8_PONDE|nr:4-hydroxy-tetrahydrodipicolinate reductase [Pontiella desulfatans]VGO16042.1 4-hydroxy-tetrahydrodipicolinate reductase [Pontiella desulfatans]
MAVKVVVLGAAGRMGKTLIRCIMEEKVPGLELHGAVDLWDAPGLNADAGVLAGTKAAGVNLISNLEEVGPSADVIVDFSGHFGVAGNAPRIAEWGTAWVIGTTGLNDEEIAAVEAAAEKTAVVLSGNMSLGINLLCHLVELGARSLKDKGYDVEIIERHHGLKKDSPSGTALMLGQAAADGYDWDLKEVQVDGRTGLPGERPEKEIGFHAVRGGDIVGDHTVMMAGVGELLELSHRATSRDVFAIGALQAAVWVAGKEARLYTMKDAMKHVLGL